MDEAEVLCDRVAVMDSGRVLQVGSPAELVRHLDAPARITVSPGQLDEAELGVAAGREPRNTHWVRVSGAILSP